MFDVLKSYVTEFLPFCSDQIQLSQIVHYGNFVSKYQNLLHF